MTAVLETNGLGKQYGKRWALDDCTLTIPEGKVVGLVGPNGAGKTTLLHLAVGLLTPTAGAITVLGGQPGRRPRPARPRRLRRSRHTHLLAAVGGEAPPHGRPPQPALGR